MDMGVQQSSKQVVRRADSMEVAREVQVDVLHGNDLGIAATCSAALDAEDRAQGRFAQRHHDVLAAAGKRVRQADRRRGLALAGGRRVDGGHQNELARRVVLVAQQVVVDLCLVVAVALQVLFVDARFRGNLGDLLRRGSLGDFNVSQHVGPSFSSRCSRRDRTPPIRSPRPAHAPLRLRTALPTQSHRSSYEAPAPAAICSSAIARSITVGTQQTRI